jgi:uncharacterized protein DUF1360
LNSPSWFQFLVLGLAAWSTYHLLANDDILDRPRRWVLRLGSEWEKEGDPVPENYRLKWGQFLSCPYCAGFWIWVAWLVAWWIVPDVVMPAAFLMGGRTIVIAGSKTLGKEEDKLVSKDAEAISDSLFEVADRISKRPAARPAAPPRR